MGHHELVDLVKQLLVERASKPTSLTNPNKDVSVAGHTSVNQESLVQSSQAILQGLAEGGYIHAKTPKFESFFGDDKKNKLDFDMWERQVLSAAHNPFWVSCQTSNDGKFEGSSFNGDFSPST